MQKFRVSVGTRSRMGKGQMFVNIETDGAKLTDGAGGSRNKIFDRVLNIALMQNPKLSDYDEITILGYEKL